jgi:hypothetical protein
MLDFQAYSLPLEIWIGAAPIVIGIYFIYRAFSAPKKKRIISILVISFALAGYICIMIYFLRIPFNCRCCGGLLMSEYGRVDAAVNEYLFSIENMFSPENKNLPTLNDLAESVGYIPPEDRKSSPLNPCVQESDLIVLISGDIEEIKILVYPKEGKCDKIAIGGGEWLRYEEVCAYL